MAVRIYTLAKDLQVDSKDLVDLCKKAGITGKGSALASLTDEEAQKVTDYVRNMSSGGGAATRPAAPAAPVREAAPVLGAVREAIPAGSPKRSINRPIPTRTGRETQEPVKVTCGVYADCRIGAGGAAAPCSAFCAATRGCCSS